MQERFEFEAHHYNRTSQKISDEYEVTRLTNAGQARLTYSFYQSASTMLMPH